LPFLLRIVIFYHNFFLKTADNFFSFWESLPGRNKKTGSRKPPVAKNPFIKIGKERRQMYVYYLLLSIVIGKNQFKIVERLKIKACGRPAYFSVIHFPETF
jgi:hypothetical protein